MTRNRKRGLPVKESQTVIIVWFAKFPLYWTLAERVTTLQFIVACSNVPDGREPGSLFYQLYQDLQLDRLRGQLNFLNTKQRVLYSHKFVSVLITFKAWQTSAFFSWNAEKCMRLLLDAIQKLIQIFPRSRFKPSKTELWVFTDAHFKVLNKQICPSKVQAVSKTRTQFDITISLQPSTLISMLFARQVEGT